MSRLGTTVFDAQVLAASTGAQCPRLAVARIEGELVKEMGRALIENSTNQDLKGGSTLPAIKHRF